MDTGTRYGLKEADRVVWVFLTDSEDSYLEAIVEE